MNLVGVIFEKGIKLSRAIDGQLYFQSVPGRQKTGIPQEVSEKYGVKPVLAIYSYPSGLQSSLLLPIETGMEVLEIQHTDFNQIAFGKEVPSLSHTFNVSYLIGAIVHHCKRLAVVYSGITSQFANYPMAEGNDPEKAISGHQPEPYFEFEALITATRRFYDSLRYILWQTFMPEKAGVPNSFKRTLERCNGLPGPLRSRLEDSWLGFGQKVSEYRDCLQHYCPVGRELPYAFMERLEGRVWMASVWIPDNPEVRSQRKYCYDLRIDALSYGWRLTNEVLELARTVIQAIPDKKPPDS